MYLILNGHRAKDPMSLEKKALTHFDRLLEAGDLLWKANDPRIFEYSPFNVENPLNPSVTFL